jgi:hypothetical protein
VVFGCSDHGQSKTAFVTFKDPKALEIALLLSVGSLVFLLLLLLLFLNFTLYFPVDNQMSYEMHFNFCNLKNCFFIFSFPLNFKQLNAFL